jgi:DNA-binding transcriptional LysR family regulator
MTLNQLRIIVAIADAGYNITHAARRVHATQPGLSKQLKQLEEYLGLQVFVRRGKSIQGLTAAGAQIIEHARAVVAEARRIRDLAGQLRTAQRNSLRIATGRTPARYVLPGLVAELRTRLPNLSVDIEQGEHDEALEQLRRGGADVALVTTLGQSPDGVDATPAFHWHRVLVAPHDHPLAALKRPLRFEDLAAYPLISYRAAHFPTAVLTALFAARGLEPNLAFSARDADVIKAQVRARLGVGLIAEVAVEDEDREDLAVIDVSHLLPRLTTWVAVPRGNTLAPAVAEFVRLLTTSAAPLEPIAPRPRTPVAPVPVLPNAPRVTRVAEPTPLRPRNLFAVPAFA